MNTEDKRELKLKAVEIREGILRSTHSAKSGHPGGSLSCAELFAYLYNVELRVDPANPGWKDRDRFVLSKGHVAPGLYAALAQRGFFPKEDLITLRHIGSYLQGHPSMDSVPGVDMSTGSLGQGISAAAGMAKGAKYLGQDIRVYTLLGDGELDEGEVWEAALFAAHYQLDNLCVIVDVNGLQIDGATKDVMNTAPLKDKFEAFGFRVTEADGHDYDALEEAFAFFHAGAGSGKPACILMKTIKGKDVSYMENVVDWHGKAPNDEQLETGLADLAAVREKILKGEV